MSQDAAHHPALRLAKHRVSGIEGWFGAAGQRPPRWKQAVAIWLACEQALLLRD